jgi:hypothetical protein
MDWLAWDFFRNSGISFYKRDGVGCGDGWKEARELGAYILVIFDDAELIGMCKGSENSRLGHRSRAPRLGCHRNFQKWEPIYTNLSPANVYSGRPHLWIFNDHQGKHKTKILMILILYLILGLGSYKDSFLRITWRTFTTWASILHLYDIYYG